MSYLYKAFGLVIESVLMFPELITVTEEAVDVQVVYNKVPYFEKELNTKEDWFVVDSDELCFVIDKVARFRVSKGNLIEIDRFLEADDDNVRLFILGSAIGGLLHQRGILPIHASAVEINGKAVLFSADSGFGKSTTCLGLQNLGYSVIADDICAIQLNQLGEPVVFPGYPQLKLWQDSIDEIGLKKVDERVRIGEDKFRFNVKDNFSKIPLPIEALFFINKKDQDEVSINEIRSLDKIKKMMTNIFRPFFVKSHDQQKRNFILISKIGDNSNFYDLTRPNHGFF